MATIPPWLQNKIPFLKSQGRLNFSGEKNLDLSILQDPEIEKQLNMLKILDISDTDVSSLDGFPCFKHFKHFNADNTQISNLRNFKSLRSLTSISLKNTPVSKNKNYRLSLYIIIRNLKQIDGQIIPDAIKAKAKQYPPIVEELINAGWIAEFPCPQIDTLIELCKQYGVEPKPIYTQPIDYDAISQCDFYEDDSIQKKSAYTGDFESTLKKLKRKHEETIRKGQALFGIIDEIDDESLPSEIAKVLKDHGIETNEKNEEEILNNVKELASQRNNE
ncbi:hypothetical protein M9Y10_034624 [Tritrichomonas musculus]|uniref:Tropomodulin n=1 Tax=Tritrichomonas musculus TaxID=1915356 RepID=A0ABR2KFI7_9EUKA